MTETDEKPEEKKPAKKGLHGWKAALAMFGCGSLAAFAFFGVVASIASLILNSFSSGFEGSDGQGGGAAGMAETTSPRDDFEEEKFDLCGISLPAISAVNLNLADSSGGPTDASLDGGAPEENDLVRSDECSGSLNPEAGALSPWEFNFAYEAIIYAPQGDEDALAREEVEQVVGEVEGRVGDASDSGDIDFLDGGTYVYGDAPGEGNEYVLVSQKRSAVLQFSVKSQEETSAAAFSNELQKFERHLDIALTNLIPE